MSLLSNEPRWPEPHPGGPEAFSEGLVRQNPSDAPRSPELRPSR